MTAPAYAPRFEVRISGLTLAADLSRPGRCSLSVETDLDLAGSFSLDLRNPDNPLLDSALLDLGKTVEIHLGYGNDLVPAFLGEIAAIEPSFPQDGRADDHGRPATTSRYKLRRSQPGARRVQLRQRQRASPPGIAVANGLVPVVDPTPGLPKQIIQVESDMAFLKARAERLLLRRLRRVGPAALPVPPPRSSPRTCWSGDATCPASTRGSPAAGLAGVAGHPRLQPGARTDHLRHGAGSGLRPATTWSSGSAAPRWTCSPRWCAREFCASSRSSNPLRRRGRWPSRCWPTCSRGCTRGAASCIGLPDLAAGRLRRRSAASGKRFSGTYRVRKVTHRIDGSGFRTDFSITQRGHTSLLGLLRKQTTEEPSPNAAERVLRGGRSATVDGRTTRWRRRRPRRRSDGSRSRTRGLSEQASSSGLGALRAADGGRGHAVLRPARRRATRCSSRSSTATSTTLRARRAVDAKQPAPGDERRRQNSTRCSRARRPRDHLRRQRQAAPRLEDQPAGDPISATASSSQRGRRSDHKGPARTSPWRRPPAGRDRGGRGRGGRDMTDRGTLRGADEQQRRDLQSDLRRVQSKLAANCTSRSPAVLVAPDAGAAGDARIAVRDLDTGDPSQCTKVLTVTAGEGPAKLRAATAGRARRAGRCRRTALIDRRPLALSVGEQARLRAAVVVARWPTVATARACFPAALRRPAATRLAESAGVARVEESIG